MDFGFRKPAQQAGAGDLIKDTTTASFMKDVVEASRSTPVLVDFWAAWCGPCKQLTPILEKVVKSYNGKVRLVKVNVDEHPAIAGQLRIQSLPTVYAFRDGRPLDGFMGAQPESAVRAFVDRLLRELSRTSSDRIRPVTAGRAAAKRALSSKETEVAALLMRAYSNRQLAQTLSMAPDTVKWHLKNIFGKLGVSNRTEAALRLKELGLDPSVERPFAG